ncbi:hypothetical protein [Ketobacter alkanivorans]|uniref:Uncharacterized protein n=1 Tax=Ketobacter alkanivorans TaxID=1917421 RepID=A0A2K9LLD6_9GAMM|nr:hypothetical protein [Ketobacter alkanivorans]AUM13166.1 hypothetical protein Kalk_12335 [Ketobacter alkanivorans]
MSNTRTKWMLWISLVLIMQSACWSQAAQQQTDLERPLVAWAGLSLSGSSNKLDILYPRVMKYQVRANQLLYSTLKGVRPEYYQLVTDDKVDLRKGNSLAMTLMVDSENVVVRQLAGLHQAVVEISASVLVYDVASDEKAVVASFPVGLGPYVETYEHSAPTPQQLDRLVEGYLFGGLSNLEAGLIETAISNMQSADIKYRYAAKIGIGSVAIAEEAAALMAPNFGSDQNVMEAYIARQTARLLSTSQKVSVIPYRVDSAVAQMVLRFTGKKTTVLLELPEPDYQLSVNVERFARKLTQENKHEQLFVYAARATIGIDDDFGDQVYQESMKNYVHKKILRSQPNINEWVVYRGALENLTLTFFQQLAAPQAGWFNLQGFEGDQRKQVQSDLLAAAEVLEQCR